MQLSPQSIERLGLITPFSHRHVHAASGMSGGLSCAGYDVHLGDTLIAPKGPDGSWLFSHEPMLLQDDDGSAYWVLWPKTGCLGVTVERFTIPDDVSMMYFNKSTLARRFMNACATLAEPGWHGHLTLEIYNQSDRPQYLIPGQPIGQVVFHQLDAPSAFPYSGKYQGQGADPVQARRE